LTIFRPCIDLHQGRVAQIVGSSLSEENTAVNHLSNHDASYFAALYRDHNLRGGHIISLGENNQQQVLAGLAAFPNGLQYGGGVNPDNATRYLQAGASHVIVTSYLFVDGNFSWSRLRRIEQTVGRQHLVLDLSCRRTADSWTIACDRWQSLTQLEVNAENLIELQAHCDEFLVHAADVEGLQAGMDDDLIALLGKHCSIPVTYAGGARSINDLQRVAELSNDRVDLTIGSALDIFGGKGVNLNQCIDWNRRSTTAVDG